MARATAGLECLALGVLLVLAELMYGQVDGHTSRSGAGSESVGEASTTPQRLETEVWWPTMSTAALEAYAGSRDCAICHADESPGKVLTSMERAASKAEHAGLLQRISVTGGGQATNSSYSPLLYALRADVGGAEYSVTNGSSTESQRLDWVVGAGDLGQTFVYQRDDRWYQSRMSAYAKAPQLDVTTGLKIDASASLMESLGKSLTPEELRHCFSCHTVHATSSRGFNPLHAEAGVGCEACHGPGAAHAKEMSGADGQARKVDVAIYNPASLSPSDSIDFCGACHRTFGDVAEAANKANDSSVVRFQPYRLQKSRCWRETQDERLTCVACHDPHEPLNRSDVSYDKHCLSCHTGDVAADHGGKACPTGAKAQCVSCHMPKVPVASMHGEFTDHFIHVVKRGESFPN